MSTRSRTSPVAGSTRQTSEPAVIQSEPARTMTVAPSAGACTGAGMTATEPLDAFTFANLVFGGTHWHSIACTYTEPPLSTATLIGIGAPSEMSVVVVSLVPGSIRVRAPFAEMTQTPPC